MPEFDPRALPFINRDMLDYSAASQFTLVVQSQSQATNAFQIRGATKAGPFVYSHSPTSDFAVKTESFSISDFPIWLTVTDTDGAYDPGHCYVRVSVAINGNIVHQLLAGYIYETKGVSWPHTRVEPTLPMFGQVNSQFGSNPAAGAECSITVPARKVWKILAFTATLVTDATAVTRQVHVLLDTGLGDPIECISPTTQTASLTRKYNGWHQGHNDANTDGTKITLNIPDGIYLPPSSTITTLTTNLQAGDNWGQPSVWVEEYFI